MLKNWKITQANVFNEIKAQNIHNLCTKKDETNR